MSKNNDSWLSIYLYYTKEGNQFLIERIKPFVEKVFENHWATGFFFIRYWENASHIRLRFNGSKEILKANLKPASIEYFSSNQNLLRPFTDHLSDNLIEFKEYQPEISRYGGPESMLICEKQFQLSSVSTLDILSRSDHFDYNSALGIALQMHTLFSKAIGLSTTEAISFFEFVYKSWARVLLNSTKNPIKVIDSFQYSYNLQKESVFPSINLLWNCDLTDLEENRILKHWYLENKNILEDLKKLRSKIDQYTSFENMYDVPPIWLIYESLIHMTNNRLGISNRDEGYLGFLLMKFLERSNKV